MESYFAAKKNKQKKHIQNFQPVQFLPFGCVQQNPAPARRSTASRSHWGRSGLPTVWTVEVPLWTLVEEHVGVTEEPAHQLGRLRRVGAGQLLLRLRQEVAQLRTGSDLGNVVASLIVAC